MMLDRATGARTVVAAPSDPVALMGLVVDPGTLQVDVPAAPGCVRTGWGLVDTGKVLVFCCDPSKGGGALGETDAGAIAHVIEAATHEAVPVVGIWQSGGARLQDGTSSLAGMGRIFRSMVRANGVAPTISVILGSAAGGAAYGPALSDFVIAGPRARVFVTGPDVVRRVTGEDVDAVALGGPEMHATSSGLIHLLEPSDDAALRSARALVGLLVTKEAGRRAEQPSRVQLEHVLPDSPRQVYDMRRLVMALLDEGTFLEVQSRWAPNVLTALGRLDGLAVGVLANNPSHFAGCLDCAGSEKGAAFVQKCDELGVPLIVLADVPGYLPGSQQESNGIVVRGARLLRAFATCTVPRVTLIVRKAYGGAFIAMNSKSLGADYVFAWPQAEVGVMYPEGAVDVLHRRRLAHVPSGVRDRVRAQLVEEYKRGDGGLARATERGDVDAVILPSETPRALRAALDGARTSGRRGPRADADHDGRERYHLPSDEPR